MKIKDLLPASASIQYLSQLQGIPVSSGFKIARVQTQIAAALAPFEATRTKMAQEYMGPNGQPKEGISNEQINKAFMELLDNESDYSLPTESLISLSAIKPDTKITPSYLSAIYGTLVIPGPHLVNEDSTIPIPNQQTILNLFNGFVSLGNMEMLVSSPLTQKILDGIKTLHTILLSAGQEGFPPPNFHVSLPVLPLKELESLEKIPPQLLTMLMSVIKE